MSEKTDSSHVDRLYEAVILQVYELHQSQPHRSIGWTAKHIERFVRRSKDFTSAEVIGAIEYLSSKGWLSHRSLKGIKYYKSGTKTFEKYSPSSFGNSQQSPITIQGNGNIVVTNAQIGTLVQNNADITSELLSLMVLIAQADIPVDLKRDAIADADTIRAQLLKDKPSKRIIEMFWGTVEKAAALAGATTLADSIIQNIHHLPHP